MATGSDPQRDKHASSAFSLARAQIDHAKQLAGFIGGPGSNSPEMLAALMQVLATNYAAEVARFK